MHIDHINISAPMELLERLSLAHSKRALRRLRYWEAHASRGGGVQRRGRHFRPAGENFEFEIASGCERQARERTLSPSGHRAQVDLNHDAEHHGRYATSLLLGNAADAMQPDFSMAEGRDPIEEIEDKWSADHMVGEVPFYTPAERQQAVQMAAQNDREHDPPEKTKPFCWHRNGQIACSLPDGGWAHETEAPGPYKTS